MHRNAEYQPRAYRPNIFWGVSVRSFQFFLVKDRASRLFIASLWRSLYVCYCSSNCVSVQERQLGEHIFRGFSRFCFQCKKKNDLNEQRQALSVNACLHFISFGKKNRGKNGNWRENIKKTVRKSQELYVECQVCGGVLKVKSKYLSKYYV